MNTIQQQSNPVQSPQTATAQPNPQNPTIQSQQTADQQNKTGIFAPVSQIAPQGQQTSSMTDTSALTHTPSPMDTAVKIDAPTAQKVVGIATGQNPPSVIKTSELPQLMQMLTQQQSAAQHSGTYTNGPAPQGFDPKNGYNGFVPSQCTSFASWYMNDVLGKPWKDTGNGNAKNWAKLAQQQGYNVDNKPQVNDIMVQPNLGTHGHVSVVTGVNDDGTVNVQEFNYKPGQYTTRSNVSAQNSQFIR